MNVRDILNILDDYLSALYKGNLLPLSLIWSVILVHLDEDNPVAYCELPNFILLHYVEPHNSCSFMKVKQDCIANQ